MNDVANSGGAMLRGAYARRSGDALSDNPYPDFPGYMIQHRAWAFGWNNSEDVIEDCDRRARERVAAQRAASRG